MTDDVPVRVSCDLCPWALTDTWREARGPHKAHATAHRKKGHTPSFTVMPADEYVAPTTYRGSEE